MKTRKPKYVNVYMEIWAKALDALLPAGHRRRRQTAPKSRTAPNKVRTAAETAAARAALEELEELELVELKQRLAKAQAQRARKVRKVRARKARKGATQ
jgi:hypothetical protein